MPRNPIIDETGNVYGRLLVVERAPSRSGYGAWWCRCECGEEVSVVGRNLRSGHTQSCGCLQRDAVSHVAPSQDERPAYVAPTLEERLAQQQQLEDGWSSTAIEAARRETIAVLVVRIGTWKRKRSKIPLDPPHLLTPYPRAVATVGRAAPR